MAHFITIAESTGRVHYLDLDAVVYFKHEPAAVLGAGFTRRVAVQIHLSGGTVAELMDDAAGQFLQSFKSHHKL